MLTTESNHCLVPSQIRQALAVIERIRPYLSPQELRDTRAWLGGAWFKGESSRICVGESAGNFKRWQTVLAEADPGLKILKQQHPLHRFSTSTLGGNWNTEKSDIPWVFSCFFSRIDIGSLLPIMHSVDVGVELRNNFRRFIKSKSKSQERQRKLFQMYLPEMQEEDVVAYCSSVGLRLTARTIRVYLQSKDARAFTCTGAKVYHRCFMRDYSALVNTLVGDWNNLDPTRKIKYQFVMRKGAEAAAAVSAAADEGDYDTPAADGIRLHDGTRLPFQQLRFYVEHGNGRLDPFVVISASTSSRPARRPTLEPQAFAAAPGVHPVNAVGVREAQMVLLATGEVYTTVRGETLLPLLDDLVSGGFANERFAEMFDSCTMCGRELTAPSSLANMMGEVCYRRALELDGTLGRHREATVTRNHDPNAWIRSTFAQPSPVDMRDVVLAQPVTMAALQHAVTKAAETVASTDGPLAVSSQEFNMPPDQLYQAALQLLVDTLGGTVTQQVARDVMYHIGLLTLDSLHLPPLELFDPLNQAMDVLGLENAMQKQKVRMMQVWLMRHEE